eukprot:snap_masked-scaffold_22-processed-gene-2.38-mRNA-1 protein AED:1.00 eAED:1.00 QI:0/0/0/0/1/1/3/0/76
MFHLGDGVMKSLKQQYIEEEYSNSLSFERNHSPTSSFSDELRELDSFLKSGVYQRQLQQIKRVFFVPSVSNSQSLK